MENIKSLPKKLIALTLGLVLMAAIVRLNAGAALPKIDLTLTQPPLGAEHKTPVAPPPDAQIITGADQDLLFVKEGILFLAEAGATKAIALTTTGQSTAPAWSHDGQWIAHVRISDPATQRGSLWLMRRDGSLAHEVQGLPGEIFNFQFSWSPSTNLLAVAVPGEGLWSVPTTGTPELLDPAPWLYQAAWSPDGRYLAYNYCLSGPEPNLKGPDNDILCVMAIEGKQRFDLVQTDDAGIRVLGWWPDGQGVLYWEVPAHGGSVATDGIMIRSVALSYTQRKGEINISPNAASGQVLQRSDTQGPQPVELAVSLPKSHWAKFSPDGRLLLVEGSGRIGWGNKQLTLINVSNGKTERLPHPLGQVALDPDIHGDTGQIAFVAAPDLGGDNWGLTEKEFSDWLQKRSLWVHDQDKGLRQITQAGGHIHGPTWSKDGKEIRYFAHDALWQVQANNQAPPQKIVDLGSCEPKGIYGSQDYNNYFTFLE